MKWLEVNQSASLKGAVKVPGSKNSSLALLAACCMAETPVYLDNIPNITDIHIVCEIEKSLGVSVHKEKNLLVIDPSGINNTDIDPVKSAAFRTAYYFVGALIARHKRVSVGNPGGDNIGPRPIDQHIKGLRALGVDFKFYNDHYVAEAERLTGADIYFDTVTSGATVNLMLAAVLAEGKTHLYNAARDPEVVDTAVLLNKMGAKIYGAGTDTIRIEGVSSLTGCSHSVIPDRLIAGAFLVAGGIAGGEITIQDVIPEHLESCMKKLAEIGLFFETTDNTITVYGSEHLRATRVRTGMYPAFSTDLQQPLTALLLKAHGRSLVADKVFPRRFNHCEQLKRMGADIVLRSGVAVINGNRPLTGAWVHASDIRAGTCLILAGLNASGTTYITGVEHIERGYEDIIRDFKNLGADIRLRQGDEDIRTLTGSASCSEGWDRAAGSRI